jgi:Na+/melibiose symporter-like transporter
MAYKEYSDEMRHFSTVRSALTTFLVTVSLAAFSAYFNKSQSHPFLVAAAVVFALAAIAVCLEFSRRTSKAYLRRKRIWNYFAKGELVRVLDDPKYPSKTKTVGVMFKDATNYFLLIGLSLIVLAFCYRDSLSAFLPALPPDVQSFK